MTIPELQEQLRQRDEIIARQAARIKELEKKVQQLEELLGEKAGSKESKPPKEASNFSVSSYERKQQRKRKGKKSTGRKPKDAKRNADSLLSQLAVDWEIEYEAIAELIATAAILYIDETGWKVGKRSCYTWVFSTLTAVFFKCGVGRGKDVLRDVLGEHFKGIGVTDDYSAYQSQFTEHQLCWAHFLRKAIALSLRNPDNPQYKRFLKSLFAIYYDAVRFSRDRRLSTSREAKVKKLQARIRMICRRYGEVLDDAAPADEARFVRLQNELVDHIEKLFVFVLHPEVEPTNNRSERQARSEAMARKAARTSKTESGAKRRSIIMSVLASLSKRLEPFTLSNVLSEIARWFETGQSVFREELASLQMAADPCAQPP